MDGKKTAEQTDIEWIKQELREIKAEVKNLNAFSWKVVGASGVISAVVVFLAETLIRGK